MHSTDPRVFHFADSVMPALETCEAFAMEVVIDETVQDILFENIFMNGETTLQSLISPAQYDSLQWFAIRNTGMSISFFDRMKPLYVAMTLEMLSGEDSILNTTDPFLDQYLQNLSMEQQKEIVGLETAEEQMSIFDVMSYKDQAQLLMKSIRDYSKDTTEFDLMVQYYLSNDLAKMMQFQNDFAIPDSLYDALITDRNIKMAKRIDSMIRINSSFIAVGAGHLGGEEGLVNLLREKNYHVIPVLPSYKNYLKDGWYRFSSIKNSFVVDFPSTPEFEMDSSGDKIISEYSAEIKDEKNKKEKFKVIVIPSEFDQSILNTVLPATNKNYHFDGQNNSFTCQEDNGLNISGKIIRSPTATFIVESYYKGKSKYGDRFFESFAILAE